MLSTAGGQGITTSRFSHSPRFACVSGVSAGRILIENLFGLWVRVATTVLLTLVNTNPASSLFRLSRLIRRLLSCSLGSGQPGLWRPAIRHWHGNRGIPSSNPAPVPYLSPTITNPTWTERFTTEPANASGQEEDGLWHGGS